MNRGGRGAKGGNVDGEGGPEIRLLGRGGRAAKATLPLVMVSTLHDPSCKFFVME